MGVASSSSMDGGKVGFHCCLERCRSLFDLFRCIERAFCRQLVIDVSGMPSVNN